MLFNLHFVAVVSYDSWLLYTFLDNKKEYIAITHKVNIGKNI